MLISYKMPLSSVQAELIIKKSKFIAHIMPIQTESRAKEFISKIKTEFRDARHVVYAYSLRNGKMHCSDDGEPAGSAGLPVLQLLLNQEITDCIITVTRYFGGILLGFGGLIRAYTEAANMVIAKSQIVQMQLHRLYELIIEYSQSNLIHELEKLKVRILKKDYTDKILLEIAINSEANNIIEHLKKYDITITPLNPKYIATVKPKN